MQADNGEPFMPTVESQPSSSGPLLSSTGSDISPMDPPMLWQPNNVDSTNMTAFRRLVNERFKLNLGGELFHRYSNLHLILQTLIRLEQQTLKQQTLNRLEQ